MKRIAALMLMMIPMTMLNGQGITFFEGTWAETLAKAKVENKLIFMDAYATWCGPCKRMAADVFPLKEAGDYYNATFVPVKIDMEKGEGLALAKLYNVRVYPTLLFINWRGEVVHRVAGGRNLEGFLELGKEALDNTRNFRSVELAYRNNPDNVEHLIAYATALKQVYDPDYNRLITDYLQGKPQSLLLSETGWKIITQFVDNPESPEFQYLLMNKPAFVKMFGQEEVNRKIGAVVETLISQTVRKNDAGALEPLYGKIRDMIPEKADHYKALAGVQYHRRNSNWAEYATAVRELITLSPDMESSALNRYAWDFYQHVDNQDHLRWMTARVGAKIKTEDTYALHDTWAALLFKTGNHKQALKEARAAIELAKKENVPYEETLELIGEIEKGKKK